MVRKSACRVRLARRIALAAVLGLGALASVGAGPASGRPGAESGGCRPPTGYTTVDIGALGTGYNTGTDLNDAGLVVGRSETADGMHAFAWRRGRLQDITPPGSTDATVVGVNERGQVAFSAFDPAAGETRTYLWRNGRTTTVGSGVAIDLNERGEVLFTGGLWRRGTVQPIVAPDGSDYTLIPQHLGDGGHVVGGGLPLAVPGGGHPTPSTGFVWHEGVLTIAVPSSGAFRQAVDVDRSGRVLFDAFGSPAALWDDGVTIDLGTLGGTTTYGADISERGAVAGSSSTASGEQHAFLWRDGRMTDLHPVAGAWSYAIEANRHGHVTGVVEDAMGRRSVVWACGHMVELGIESPYGQYPIGINDRGQVLSAAITVDGNRVFLSTPTRR